MEALIAATASGSALAALTFWQTADGKVVWTVLTAVSAVLAVIKPLLKLTERITKFEELATGYSLLDHGYGKLVVAISQRRTFDRDLQLQFQALLDQADDLKAKEVIERRLDQTLREVCEHAVGAELPPAKFFVPEII